jgi:hypothetical protein
MNPAKRKEEKSNTLPWATDVWVGRGWLRGERKGMMSGQAVLIQ